MPPVLNDLVIVGHGAAGLAAALSAAEEARGRQINVRIRLLERTAALHAGGNTRWSPSYMRMASPREVAPGFEQEVLAASGGRADVDYVRRLAACSPEAIAWAEGHGIDFHCPTYYLSAGPPRIQPVGGGEALVHALCNAARATNIAIEYECTAERLITDEGGRIRGVAVRRGANETLDILPASAVVLASGGFQGNADMLREHLGAGAESLRLISPGSHFNAGAGIRMAQSIGAKSAGDWDGMHAEPIDARSTRSAPIVLVYPYGIVVDRDGRRFFDEGAGLAHETWETFARAIHFATPNRTAYAILDSKLFAIEDYERAIRSEVPPIQADSIETLARMTGISPAGLIETVEEYNAAAIGDANRFDATRIDGLAAASTLTPPKANWARPIDRPPYLAYPLVGAIAYTFGGLATTIEAEVLGENGPIPGLFAAGEITGHFYGLAPNAVAVLRALVFGRIAGKNAATYLARACGASVLRSANF